MARTVGVTLGIVLVLLALSISQIETQVGQLLITASIDITDYVSVSGRVLEKPGTPVSGAAVTVQGLDPFGSSIHISRTFTDQAGSFSARFALTPKIFVGKYTIYITASKEGYADGYYSASFPITAADFSIAISPSLAVVEQGETALFNVMVTGGPGFNETVTMSPVSGLPQGASHEFSTRSASTNSSLTLSIKTSPDIKVGHYTFTVAASSTVRSQSTQAILVIIAKREISIIERIIPIILAVGVVGIVLLRNRIREAIMHVEPKVTKGYLAITRALVRLEELRAEGKIDQETYLKIRREYEEKLQKQRRQQNLSD